MFGVVLLVTMITTLPTLVAPAVPSRTTINLAIIGISSLIKGRTQFVIETSVGKRMSGAVGLEPTQRNIQNLYKYTIKNYVCQDFGRTVMNKQISLYNSPRPDDDYYCPECGGKLDDDGYCARCVQEQEQEEFWRSLSDAERWDIIKRAGR